MKNKTLIKKGKGKRGKKKNEKQDIQTRKTARQKNM